MKTHFSPSKRNSVVKGEQSTATHPHSVAPLY